MTLGIKSTSGNLTTTAGPTTQTFEVAGFGAAYGTPKAAIIWITHSDSTSPHASEAQFSAGFTDGTRNVCYWNWDEDGVATTDCAKGVSDRRCGLILQTGPDTQDVSVDFNAWTSNGVTLDVVNTASDDYNIVVTLIGGTDIDTAAANGGIYCNIFDDLGTGTAAVSVTDPGFQADLVLFYCAGLSGYTTNNEFFSNTNPGFTSGAWIRDGSDTQRCNGWQARRAVTSPEVTGYLSTGDSVMQVNNSSMGWRGACSSNANGFAITPTASAANDHLIYLAIKWATPPNIDLITTTMPSSAVDWSETALSFTPEFVMLSMSEATAIDTVVSAGDIGFSMHTLQSGQAYSIGIASQDAGGGTQNSDTASFYGADFRLMQSDATSTKSQGALTSLDSGGWTIGLAAGSHDSVARKGWALAIKAASNIVIPVPLGPLR